ncbi:uncharacterized protein BO66DRAFT_443967 [Aspergillus aculeatinus CBS 121060]|uniref:Uncharacterized protein n=1 Tax=Aspergillus aculeatinus CBS 121060 TaxID=1448322 RepID=A0ACD1GTF3_9EURO|nr:hypothetical protein BO66DRAFT_443967 [Aspergillus aculeatinus CBS 121060]RAH64470.1 hypothetical protein BO66DRAFT_443967 [Aspergillus aculeatinus CBS 121060]
MPPGREGLKPIDADIPEAERRNAQREGLKMFESAYQRQIKEIRSARHGRPRPGNDRCIGSHCLPYSPEVRGRSDWKQNEHPPNSPSHGVHSDITHASCRPVLKEILPADEMARLMGCRFVVVNVWRPIKPARKDPLAVCDWRSVDPASDIFPDRRVIAEQVFEFGVSVFNEKHEWYYLSN